MLESEIHKQVALAASENQFVTFKNTTGQAWTGTRVSQDRSNRTVIIYDARPIRFGLITGGADRIGWKSITISEEMVGKTIAVFSAIECKTKIGKISAEQQNFIDRVRGAGGIAFIARRAQDVAENLKSWITAIMT